MENISQNRIFSPLPFWLRNPLNICQKVCLEPILLEFEKQNLELCSFIPSFKIDFLDLHCVPRIWKIHNACKSRNVTSSWHLIFFVSCSIWHLGKIKHKSSKVITLIRSETEFLLKIKTSRSMTNKYHFV